MDEALRAFAGRLADVSLALLFAYIAAALFALGKAAHLLVDEAVLLARRWGVPTAIIGATIVSLGTTTPEVSISALAARRGEAGLALGNAVGSVICNTGLVLGLSCLAGAVPFDPRVAGRQGGALALAALLLTGAAYAFDGRLPRVLSLAFLALLAGYLGLSARWAKEASAPAGEAGEESFALVPALKLLAAAALVALSSRALLPGVQVAAARLGVPNDVIAATLVAFGTSLPELVTCVSAVRKGYGELAAGNVLGADILNLLFVVGAALALAPGGLAVPETFFKLHFPAMIATLLLLGFGVALSGATLKRPAGALLLLAYAVYLSLQASFLG